MVCYATGVWGRRTQLILEPGSTPTSPDPAFPDRAVHSYTSVFFCCCKDQQFHTTQSRKCIARTQNPSRWIGTGRRRKTSSPTTTCHQQETNSDFTNTTMTTSHFMRGTTTPKQTLSMRPADDHKHLHSYKICHTFSARPSASHATRNPLPLRFSWRQPDLHRFQVSGRLGINYRIIQEHLLLHESIWSFCSLSRFY